MPEEAVVALKRIYAVYGTGVNQAAAARGSERQVRREE